MLKLFIWEGPGVLESYGTGLIVVLARDAEHARELALANGITPPRLRSPHEHSLDEEGVWYCYGSE